MRDRWLRDAFAVGVPAASNESEPNNHSELRPVAATNSIDEEEAVRLLMDYGICEDKAKVRLQVCRSLWPSFSFDKTALRNTHLGNSIDKSGRRSWIFLHQWIDQRIQRTLHSTRNLSFTRQVIPLSSRTVGLDVFVLLNLKDILVIKTSFPQKILHCFSKQNRGYVSLWTDRLMSSVRLDVESDTREMCWDHSRIRTVVRSEIFRSSRHRWWVNDED